MTLNFSDRGTVVSGFFLVCIAASFFFATGFSVPMESVQERSEQTVRSGFSGDTSLPVDDAARALVLERLVPTKAFTNIPLLRAVMRVPRELFVPKDFTGNAYTDLPIPLGAGQTLISPFEAVYALQQLNLYPADQVLVIGSGVGYPAAIAAQLADRVTALETLSSLQRRDNDAVKALELKNLWIKGVSPEQAKKETGSFDKIFVLASFPEDIPSWLSDRLNEGGLLVVPIGTCEAQRLSLFTKNNGKLTEESLIGVCPRPSFPATENFPIPEGKNSFLEESFEYDGAETGTSIPGWFDLRNVSLRPDAASPDGGLVLWFDSSEIRTQQRRKDALCRKKLAEEKISAENGDLPDLELSPLTLRQREEERTTLAIRVFALNGKNIRKISFSCYMEGVALVSERKYRRAIITSSLVFFDENRTPLQEIPLTALGIGNTPWKEYRVPAITVPKKTREAELRLGLFAGYGVLKVDALVIKRTE